MVQGQYGLSRLERATTHLPNQVASLPQRLFLRAVRTCDCFRTGLLRQDAVLPQSHGSFSLYVKVWDPQEPQVQGPVQKILNA